MARGLSVARRAAQHRGWEFNTPVAPAGAVQSTRRLPMQWQTPQAADIRFGFEITMYVAAR
jgi:coenzyme PQQ precursor peptide PqqA